MGKPQKRNEELTAIAVALYEKTGSGNAVAKRLGLSPPTVYRMLTDAGVSVPDRHAPELQVRKRKLQGELAEAVVREYLAGAQVTELSTKYGAGEAAIRTAVRAAGHETRAIGGPKRVIPEEQRNEFLRLYAEGLSQAAIAARFSCSQPVVSRILRRNGVDTRRHGGDAHHAWKGGATITANGYVQVMVAATDTFATMRNQMGYVLQHRLNMARALGRPLSRGETVHHLNGDRADNRLENLQLRQGQHGAGVVMKCACCGGRNIVASEIE